LSFSFIAKIKIKGREFQNIIYPWVRDFDNQKYPDDISIEKNNEIINIARLTYSTFQNCYILTSVKYGKLSYRSNIKQRMYIKF
jgi:hypothetical protein